jgi:hypothetical protein
MTTVSLQRATQIANRIRLATTFETKPEEDDYYARRRAKKTKPTFVTSVEVNIDGNPRQTADALRLNLHKHKNTLFRLMEIGTRLRTSIASRQVEAGVNALVTERVMVVEKIKMLEALVASVEIGVYEGTALDASAAAARSRLSNATQGAVTATISTPLLTKEDRDDLTTELRALRSRQFEIDDQLSAKNATSVVTVDQDDYGFLKEHGYA